MKPILLRLRAFGPFAGEESIDFSLLGQAPLFLIHGPTGAGKTTLLDGLCYALYGEASGDQRSAKWLRSDHAAPEGATEVELVFSLGGQGYRILRRPEQMRPKLKGAGFTQADAEAELWKLGLEADARGEFPAAARLLAAGTAKVHEAIIGLLGFSVHQFRQVVLLPQGQFQRLLHAPSGEREDLLEALFKTIRYSRIQEALAREASKSKAEAEKLFAHTEVLLRQAGLEGRGDPAAPQRDLAADKAEAEAHLSRCLEAEKQAREAWTAAEKCLREYQRLDEAQARRDLWSLADKDMLPAEATRQAAQKAAALEGLFTARGMAEEQAQNLARQALLADAAFLRAEADRTSLQKDLQAARRSAEDLPRLESRLRQLEDAEPVYREWSQTAAEAAGAAAGKRRAETEWTTCRDLLESLRGQWRALEAGLSGLQEQALRRENLRGQIEKARAECKALTDYAHSQEIEARLSAELEKAASLCEAARQDWQNAREDHQERQNRRLHAQAIFVAGALMPEQPCPVCGSTSHPRIAQGETEGLDDAALEMSRQASAEKEKRFRQAESQKRDLEMAISREEAGRKSLLAHPLPDPAGGLADAQTRVRALEDSLQAAEEAAQALEIRRRESALLAARMEAGERKVAEIESAKQAAADADLAWRTQQQGLEKRWLAWKVRWEEEAGGDGGNLDATWPVLEEAGTWLSRRGKIAADIQSRRAALKLAEDRAETAGREWEKTKALREESARLQTEAEKETQARHEALARAYLAAGFDSYPAYLAARLDPGALTALESKLQAHRMEIRAIEEIEAAAGKALSGSPRPDLAALKADHDAWQAQTGAAQQRLGELKKQIEYRQDLQRQIEATEGLYAEAAARHHLASGLHQAASGTGESRVSFQRFVLGALLDDVLILASERLERMSRGRYALERAAAVAGGRSRAGLDLVVADNHTGTRRPAGMLSGGETFLASLALALGLADVVQAYAGGLHLDSLFIDEGFGTLDPEALDQALQSLEALREGGRLVGVISHVAELKERIAARIEILPTPRGSSLRVIA